MNPLTRSRGALVCAAFLVCCLGERLQGAEVASPWYATPIVRPPVPEAERSSWARNPIDAFVLARLESEGLGPSDPAPAEVLYRRASLDLLGEPLSAFTDRQSLDSQRFDSWVDDALGWSQFGERWARYWMDLTRYSDSNGYNADEYRPHIWRYRDYLIDAFNKDKPYDQLIVEQLAGDLLPDGAPEALIATGYLRLWPYESNQRDVDGQWNSILDEVVDITGEVFLGLGLKCARCHDHKFDPILQEDYYRTRAVFSGILPDDALVVATPEQRRADARSRDQWLEATAAIRQRLAQIEAPAIARAERDARSKFAARYQGLLNADRDTLGPYDRQIRDLAYRQLALTHKNKEKYLPKEDQEEWERLRERLSAFDHLEPPARPAASAVREVGPTAPEMRTPDRRLPGDLEPGVVSVLWDVAGSSEAWQGEGDLPRRLVFARWVADARNPLTARVMVNRIWARYFGRGLAPSLSDFGNQGAAPSHPELLDWLASEFIDNGWSVKEIVRLILTSATYRQRSDGTPSAAAARVDPDNRLYWRAPVRRMDGDQVRDAMLRVSGELDETVGGPSEPAPSLRRSVYLRWMRNDAPEMVATFDGPDCFNSVPQREVTTTAPQALLLLNGSFAADRARAFAERAWRSAGSSPRQQAQWVYWRACGREPSSALVDTMESFLLETRAEWEAAGREDAGRVALRDLCHTIFNANPFLAIE